MNDKETFAELLDAFLSGPIPSKVGVDVMGCAATVGAENRVTVKTKVGRELYEFGLIQYFKSQVSQVNDLQVHLGS